jgi:pimeloyl-ACP methyl ester carboxylesterase
LVSATESGLAFVREAGAGPPVICLHSSAASSAQWRPLMDALADRYRLLAPDLYGSGKSPAWRGDRRMTLADEAALLEPVFASTDERCHVVAHSYGAAVAIAAALAYPTRVASLIVFEPVLFALLMADDPTQPAAHEIVRVRDDTIAALDRGDLHGAAARFVDYWMCGGAWAAMPDARRDALARAMPAVRGQFDAAFSDSTPPSAFAALRIPVLSMIGSASPASTRAVARLLATRLPDITTIELDGVGHMAPIAHADRVNARIAHQLGVWRAGRGAVAEHAAMMSAAE